MGQRVRSSHEGSLSGACISICLQFLFFSRDGVFRNQEYEFRGLLRYDGLCGSALLTRFALVGSLCRIYVFHTYPACLSQCVRYKEGGIYPNSHLF